MEKNYLVETKLNITRRCSGPLGAAFRKFEAILGQCYSQPSLLEPSPLPAVGGP